MCTNKIKSFILKQWRESVSRRYFKPHTNPGVSFNTSVKHCPLHDLLKEVIKKKKDRELSCFGQYLVNIMGPKRKDLFSKKLIRRKWIIVLRKGHFFVLRSTKVNKGRCDQEWGSGESVV
jgi:hypothetical protein